VAAINRLNDTRADLDDVLRKLEPKGEKDKAPEGKDPNKALKDAAKDLQKKLSEVERKLYVPPTTKGIVDDSSALNRTENAARAIGSSWAAPGPNAQGYLAEAEAKVDEALGALNQLLAGDVAAFRQKVEEAKLGLLAPAPPIEVK